MRVYNRFIVSLAVVFGITNALLALSGQDDLSVYFSVDSIVYIATALFYTDQVNLKARAAIYRLSAIIFSVFLIVLVFKLVEILK